MQCKLNISYLIKSALPAYFRYVHTITYLILLFFHPYFREHILFLNIKLKVYLNPISVFIFNEKIYSLCQNNSISKFFFSKFSFKYYIHLLFS